MLNVCLLCSLVRFQEQGTVLRIQVQCAGYLVLRHPFQSDFSLIIFQLPSSFLRTRIFFEETEKLDD